jgi:predicted nucleic acid-binding Zn ribbon protein
MKRPPDPGQLSITRDLCAVCGDPIQQPARGRRRRTCGDRCRQELHRREQLRQALNDVSQKAAGGVAGKAVL